MGSKHMLRSIKDKLLFEVKKSLFYLFRLIPIKNDKIVILNTNNCLSRQLKAVFDELIKSENKNIIILSDHSSQLYGLNTIKYGSIRSIFEIVTSNKNILENGIISFIVWCGMEQLQLSLLRKIRRNHCQKDI
jgi:hypothetical protein